MCSLMIIYLFIYFFSFCFIFPFRHFQVKKKKIKRRKKRRAEIVGAAEVVGETDDSLLEEEDMNNLFVNSLRVVGDPQIDSDYYHEETNLHRNHNILESPSPVFGDLQEDTCGMRSSSSSGGGGASRGFWFNGESPVKQTSSSSHKNGNVFSKKNSLKKSSFSPSKTRGGVNIRQPNNHHISLNAAIDDLLEEKEEEGEGRGSAQNENEHGSQNQIDSPPGGIS